MNMDLTDSLKRFRDAYRERTEVEQARNALIENLILELRGLRHAHEEHASNRRVIMRTAEAVQRIAKGLDLREELRRPRRRL